MSTNEVILQEINNAPQEFSFEVLEITRALKHIKSLDANEPALLSQETPAKDWLSPGEDEAWKDL
jgi:hypothetical protein